MYSHLNLKGKVALVTGASRGIGKEIARQLAGLGADVALLSRKQEALDAVAEEIRKDFGVRAFPLACHAGKTEAIREAVAKVASELGRIDILVNNAATNPQFGFIIDSNEDVFKKILETNVVGYYTFIKECVPHMEKVGAGAVVNLASVAGLSPMPLIGLYSVSKAATINLTKVFAKELGPRGIRVNAVAPGLIKTDFSAALWQSEEVLAEVLKSHAIPRIGEPREPAQAVAFLCSDAASLITGTVLTVDGGETI